MEAEPSKADPAKHKRRWHQFRLRSLMIVVTLFCLVAGVCGYVAREAKTVRERREWRYEHAVDWAVPGEQPVIVQRVLGDPFRSPSFFRLWLGDKPAKRRIAVEINIGPSEIEKGVSLFPEAEIWVIK